MSPPKKRRWGEGGGYAQAFFQEGLLFAFPRFPGRAASSSNRASVGGVPELSVSRLRGLQLGK